MARIVPSTDLLRVASLRERNGATNPRDAQHAAQQGPQQARPFPSVERENKAQQGPQQTRNNVVAPPCFQRPDLLRPVAPVADPEAFEERAAILEFEATYSRPQAERIAQLEESFTHVMDTFLTPDVERAEAWAHAVANLDMAEQSFHATAALIRAGWQPLTSHWDELEGVRFVED